MREQEILKQKGNDLLKQGKYQAALHNYRQALRQFDEKLERDQIHSETEMLDLLSKVKLPCLKNISLCYLKTGKNKECIQTCDQILEIEHDCSKTLYRKGMAYLADGYDVPAEQALKKAYLLKPEEQEFMKALAQIQQKRQKAVRQQEIAQKKNQSKIIQFLRIFVCLLIPLNFMCKLFLRRELPFYKTLNEWTH